MNLKQNFFAPLLFLAVLFFIGIAPWMVELANGFSDDAFLSVTIIQLLVYLLPLAFYCRGRNLNLVNGLKISYFSLKKIPFFVVMALILIVGSTLFRYAGLFWFESAFVDTPAILHFAVKSDREFLTVLCAVILPAALEEFVFRGILLEEYRAYGSGFAVVMTALMYAMAHLSIENFLYYFFLGLIFGVLTVAFDSIVPSLVLHGFHLFSYYYIRPVILDYLRQAGKSPLLPYLMIACFIFLFYLLFARLEQIYQGKAYDEMLESRKEMLRKELESTEEIRSEENGAKDRFFLNLKEMYLSPTFIVSVVCFIVMVSGIFSSK